MIYRCPFPAFNGVLGTALRTASPEALPSELPPWAPPLKKDPDRFRMPPGLFGRHRLFQGLNDGPGILHCGGRSANISGNAFPRSNNPLHGTFYPFGSIRFSQMP